MSDTVYAIASGKGGVGKTTTAINVSAMLADRGHSVVVVDTDLGMANLADFLDFEIETPTLHEVLAGDAAIEDAIDRAPGGIDVLPSATDIEAFAKSNPANLQGVVADLREKYDYVMLDTGAGVSYDTLVPLALADAVLLVATPDVASVRDTAKTGELAERVESEVAGAVLAQRSSDILNADDVEETLGTDVLAVIPQDEAVPMGIDAGRPLAAFAPHTPAGQAYQDLAAVLTGEADPDPELDAMAEESDADGPADESAEQSADETAGLSAEGSPEEGITESDAGDDPLSPDAAQNVRDAIGGDSASLFGEQSEEAAGRDETAKREQTAGSEGTADPPTEPETQAEADATGGPEADATAGDGPSDELGGSGDSEARSVDDLINEHISDERLAGDDALGSDAGDDPLEEMRDDLAEDAGEDPFADADREQTRVDDSVADFDAEAPSSGAGDDGPESNVGEATASESGVPFEESGPDRRGAAVGTGKRETPEREVGVPEANEGETSEGGVSEPEIGEDETSEPETDDWESDGDGPSEPPADEDPFEEVEDDEDSGGVLGRIGSLFK